MYSNNKGIGPVIASGLLLVVAIVSVVTFQTWFNTYSSNIFGDVETQSSDSVSSSNIDSIIDGTLYFKNSGTQNITISSIKVGSVDCNVSQSISPGVTSIDVSSCVNGTSGSNEVVVISNQKVFSKKLYLTSSTTSSSNSSNNSISLSFSTNTSYIYNGSSVNLSWSSTGASSCSGTGNWSGSKDLNSNEVITQIDSNRSYTLTCINSENSTSLQINITLFELLYESSTSYSNIGGSGNRTSIIALSNGDDWYENPPLSLIDGVNPSTLAYFPSWGSGTTSNYWVQFNFSGAKVIDEIKWYQQNSNSHGTWKFQGSNDSSVWTDIGSTFTLGSSASQTITEISSNTDAYKYYRLQGVSGAVHNNPWLYEIEFKTKGQYEHTSSINLGSNISVVNYGDSINLSWNGTYVSSCEASGNWSGNKATSNYEIIENITSPLSFNLDCVGFGEVSDSINITVNSPSLNFSANKTWAPSGSYLSNLTWNSGSSNYCSASGDWSGIKNLSGSQEVNISTNSSYILTCYGYKENSVVEEINLTIGGEYPVFTSCQDAYNGGVSTSGVQSIDVDGDGGLDAFDVYCDMTNSGGGWSLIGIKASGSSIAPSNIFSESVALVAFDSGDYISGIPINVDKLYYGWDNISASEVRMVDHNNTLDSYMSYTINDFESYVIANCNTHPVNIRSGNLTICSSWSEGADGESVFIGFTGQYGCSGDFCAQSNRKGAFDYSATPITSNSYHSNSLAQLSVWVR